jgi:hypothetical protein
MSMTKWRVPRLYLSEELLPQKFMPQRPSPFLKLLRILQFLGIHHNTLKEFSVQIRADPIQPLEGSSRITLIFSVFMQTFNELFLER